MLETAPRPKVLSERFPPTPRRTRAARLLDTIQAQWAFGIALPLLFVVLAWDLEPWTEEPQEWFRLGAHHTLALVTVLATCLAVWSLLGPRGNVVNRGFAVALAVGAAMAGIYAAFAWFEALLMLPALGSRYAGLSMILFIACTLLAAVSTLAMITFARQSVRAWMASGNPPTARPWRAIAIWIGGVYVAGAAVMLAGIGFREHAFARLRASEGESIEDAMGSLRMAAFLRGEDWLLRDLSWAPEDESFRQNLDESFFRITGKTASDRAIELEAD